jgi:hypothetical protein
MQRRRGDDDSEMSVLSTNELGQVVQCSSMMLLATSDRPKKDSHKKITKKEGLLSAVEKQI